MSFPFRKAIVTGGAGFIGSHLARALVEAGDEVAVLSRPGSSTARPAKVRMSVAALSRRRAASAPRTTS